MGKTVSAEYFSRWPLIDNLFEQGPYEPYLKHVRGCHSIFYTPKVSNTPTQIRREIEVAQYRLKMTTLWGERHHAGCGLDELPQYVNLEPRDMSLLIVDEADRLKVQSIEELRDVHDRLGIGLILIGMPGLEKKMARFAQFYSRVGFLHEFRPLSQQEVKFILSVAGSPSM